jgi:hypothetical protein
MCPKLMKLFPTPRHGRSRIENATSEIVEFVVAATEIDIAGDRAGIVDDIVAVPGDDDGTVGVHVSEIIDDVVAGAEIGQPQNASVVLDGLISDIGQNGGAAFARDGAVVDQLVVAAETDLHAFTDAAAHGSAMDRDETFLGNWPFGAKA